MKQLSRLSAYLAHAFVFLILSQLSAQARDYDPHKKNQLPPFYWEGNATVQAGSSPDNSHEIFLSLIENASESIYLEAYLLRSADFAEAIEAAALRGVNVEILLDGWTVAKSKDEKVDQLELYYAKKIVDAGGKVTYMKSSNSKREDRRFIYIHSKYAIFDEETVFMGSENFANGGFSPTKDGGNRGWVIAIKNHEVAEAYVNVFKKDISPSADFDDLAAYGSEPSYTLKDDNFVPNNPAKPGTYIPSPSEIIHGFMSVERIISPDDSTSTDRAIIGAIKSAAESVDIEALSFSPHWGNNQDTPATNPNPVAEAVLNAARQGVKVRVLVNPPIFGTREKPEEPEPPKNILGLLSATWEDFTLFALPTAVENNPGSLEPPARNENTRDNKFLIKYFRETAEKENLDLDVHYFAASDNKLRALHNKGLIVDQTKVLVSSINWVENSFKNNREVGVLVDSAEVADYYNRLFELDWKYFRRAH